ncbi:guanine nucleotide binding protein, alpha subunit [Gilbertella persicaria]|uniref:guanine nucleotide binding protein, alpha subunit n=1 Tax=Gilbertella persicaria TaxID=101096 RepID=UPI00221E5330|nr:guanine nucleotide binding protein, alpha subunit [Gilbertella persicaria]KAI8075830.1 guanine nucleotide binding protein, alpha subunit [Gilbertella persicaria]
MGNSLSSRSKAIDKQLKMERKKVAKEIKILLLGAGDSGKSTIIKQMRLIHASGFSKIERENFRAMIFTNLLGSMQALLESMHLLNLTLSNQENWNYITLFEDVSSASQLSIHEPYLIDYLSPLKSLWQDESIQTTFSKGHTFAFNENIKYFFDQLDRLFDPEYMPTDADIIHCRIKTTGIVETKFRNGSVIYRMFDVGGQRSERKKWIHCFDNVAAILFVAALSGYDCCLVEDKYSNQMYEAFMLFESICNSKWFVNTSIILFLNKADLFEEKVTRSRIKDYFPDYQGSPTNVDQGKEFFKTRFMNLNNNAGKQIYVHYTVATDTRLLAHVMESVSDSILHENLQTLLL